MAKNDDAGLYQLPNGNWGFRSVVIINGERHDTNRHLDDDHQPFLRKKDAKAFKEKLEYELKHPPKKEDFEDCKLQEIWDYYLNNTAASKRPTTVKKYTSLWERHIKEKFGDKLISQITVGDINTYLSDLYNNTHIDKKHHKEIQYSFKYVEGFLKLFYQLFGLAYSLEKIDPLRYTRMFLDQGTKVRMPKIRQQDYEEYETLKVYNSYEISIINDAFKDSDLYTVFLLGYMCGLRISEAFGVMWSDYNWDTRTLTVCRQLNYDEGILSIGPVKTLKSSREVLVNDFLHEHLKEKFRQQKRHPAPSFKLKASEIVLDLMDEKTKPENAKQIVGGDFINRRKNGALLTNTAIGHYTRTLGKLGIEFQFHSLRKTHLTQLANGNCPAVEVMNRAGHKKFETTMKYYISQTEESKRQLNNIINSISVEEQDVLVPDGYGGQKLVKEHIAEKIKEASAMIPH